MKPFKLHTPLLNKGYVMKAPILNGPYNNFASLDIKLERAEVWQVIKDFDNIYSWCPIYQKIEDNHALTDQESSRHYSIDGFNPMKDKITDLHPGYGYVYKIENVSVIEHVQASWWLTSLNHKLTRLNLVLSYQIKPGVLNKLKHNLFLKNKLESLLPNTLEALSDQLTKQSQAHEFELIHYANN